MAIKSKTGFIILLTLTGILFVGFTAFTFQMETQKRRIPYYGQVKNFQLTDAQGNLYGLPNLQNKVWVANFFFTTCGDICPVMSKNIASLYRSYKLTEGVAFVSITVNPEQDDTSALTQYAQRFNVDSDSWHFLTGARQDIRDLSINSFKIGSIEEPIFHSAKLVLVDRQANIRGYYEGTNQRDVQLLFKDLAQLIKE